MKKTHLTQAERYHIQALWENGEKPKQIALRLGRAETTIRREIKRNSNKTGRYDAGYSHKQYLARKKNRSAYKLTQPLKDKIVRLIELKLSPEQVCAYLAIQDGIKLHHETIYRFVMQDKKQGGTLQQHLRICSKKYRKRYKGKKWTKGKMPNRTDITERPEIVNNKERIGDWEADTVIGKNQNSLILTLTERKTKFTIIRKLKSKNAKGLAKKMIEALKPFGDKVKTVTMDNGVEFFAHSIFADALKIQTYFAQPYHSWERGLNENTNGLIRQYFPKGTDFTKVSPQAIRKVQDALNNRPRKTLGWRTPNFEFLGVFVPLI